MKWIPLGLLVGVISLAFLGVVISGESPGKPSSLTEVETSSAEDEDAVVETEDDEDKAMYIKFAGDGIEDNEKIFKPTKEWQQVKPGQSIPKGLHVRMNLQTGVNEAKLLDEEENLKESSSKSLLKVEEEVSEESVGSKSTNLELEAAKIRMEAALREAARELELEKDSLHYWKDGDREGMMNFKKQSFSQEELRDALKKFKATRDDVQDEKLKEESLKKTFRTYEELKKDFEKMNVGIKTDQEILTQLVESYQDKDILMSKKLSILDELEYLLHQVDNALSFVDMGGFDMVAKELNSTDPELRSQALLVLGGALQSNPKVQIHALEAGVLHQLVRMVATETDSNILNRILYCLSSLLRHFPYAQNKFFQVGGLHALTDFMSNIQTQPKVKVKILTLVNDLVTERRLANRHTDREDEQDNLKLQQYLEVDLEKLLEELSWCHHLPPLLHLPEHDKREKVLVAMTTIQDFCLSFFKDNDIRNLLSTIKLEYQKLSESEVTEDDKYFTGVLNIVDTLLQTIATRKDEL